MMTKEELITKALKDAYSYVIKQEQTEETGELLIILFKAEMLVEKSNDIQPVICRCPLESTDVYDEDNNHLGYVCKGCGYFSND